MKLENLSCLNHRSHRLNSCKLGRSNAGCLSDLQHAAQARSLCWKNEETGRMVACRALRGQLRSEPWPGSEGPSYQHVLLAALQPIAGRSQLNHQSKQTVWARQIRTRRRQRIRAATNTTTPRHDASSCPGPAPERQQSRFRLSPRVTIQIASQVSRPLLSTQFSFPAAITSNPLEPRNDAR